MMAITATFPIPTAMQFTCDAAVIPNQRINLVFGLRRRIRGWSVAARPVTDVLFTALKAMDEHQTELTWGPHHTRYPDVYQSPSDWSLQQ